MAYETGTANSPGDLLVKLLDFALLNGWTIDEDIISDAQTPPQGAIHRNNVYVSFYFFSDVIKMYPARGYTVSSDPGEHPESRYNDTLTTQTTGIQINGLTGPFSAYHFFEDDTYIHIVVSLSNGSYRHFGFGEMTKFGDWQGGEYFYGHFWNQGATVIDVPTSTTHAPGLTARSQQTTGQYNRPVFYAKKNDNSAMPGARAADAFWFSVMNTKTTDQNDADSRLVNTAYIITSGDGGMASPLIPIGRSQFNGFVGMVPIHFASIDLDQTPDNLYFLGTAPDVRGVNVGALQGSNEYIIGSDTWMVFPMTRANGSTTSDEEYSANMGYAYRRVNT